MINTIHTETKIELINKSIVLEVIKHIYAITKKMSWYTKFVNDFKTKSQKKNNYKVVDNDNKPPDLIVTDTTSHTINLNENSNENANANSNTHVDDIIDCNYDHREILTYGSLLHYDNYSNMVNHEKIVEITKKLWINNNKIDNIPEYFIFLVNVVELYANDNEFTTVPENIIHLKNLRHLCFHNNLIKTLPSDMFYLKKLRLLDLSSNNITEIPTEIRLLVNLRRLYLDNNEIDELPEEVFELTKLRILDLHHNHLCDISNSIILLEHLKYLDISENNDINELTPQVEMFLNTIQKVIRGKTIALPAIKSYSHVSTHNRSNNSSTSLNRSQRGRPPKYNLTNTNNFSSRTVDTNTSSFDLIDDKKYPTYIDNYIYNNYNDGYISNLKPEEKASFDELCRLSDIEFEKTSHKTSTIDNFFRKSEINNENNNLSTIVDDIPSNLVESEKELWNDNENVDQKDDDISFEVFDFDSAEDYESINFHSSDDDLYDDKKNISYDNFIEFNKENYKDNIIKKILKFIKFYDIFVDSGCVMIDRDMIKATNLVKNHTLLSKVAKRRILEIMTDINLLDKLRPTDKELDDEGQLLLSLHTNYFFDCVATIIEMLPVKDDLYMMINIEVNRIFSWDIKNVNIIVNKIYNYVDNYQTQSMNEFFATYCH